MINKMAAVIICQLDEVFDINKCLGIVGIHSTCEYLQSNWAYKFFAKANLSRSSMNKYHLYLDYYY